jgi:hypothetical protein
MTGVQTITVDPGESNPPRPLVQRHFPELARPAGAAAHRQVRVDGKRATAASGSAPAR